MKVHLKDRHIGEPTCKTLPRPANNSAKSKGGRLTEIDKKQVFEDDRLGKLFLIFGLFEFIKDLDLSSFKNLSFKVYPPDYSKEPLWFKIEVFHALLDNTIFAFFSFKTLVWSDHLTFLLVDPPQNVLLWRLDCNALLGVS